MRSRPARTLSVVTLVLAAFVLFWPRSPARAAFPASFVAHRFAVATDNAEASETAAEVLRAGGNAADGAIAAALALGVVHSAASGLGGGGFATVCQPDGRCSFVDFREVAPAGLTAYRLAAPNASVVGGLAVAVPGEPAGLVELSQRFGRMPLERVTVPVVRLARRGFRVTTYLSEQIATVASDLAHDEVLAREFLPGGRPLMPGTVLARPVLARTIERFGRERSAFVRGEYAERVAQTVAAHGGVLTAADIAAYVPVVRDPLRGAFREYTIVTAPPPSAGGLIVLESFHWLATADPATLSHGSSAYDHRLAEAWRGAYDDRSRYVGDPAAGGVTAEALLAPERLRAREERFDPAHAGPVVVVEPARDHGTTHICVIDADGMAVALTTTLNTQFGARFVVPDLDVVLNDEIDDFSLGTPGNNWSMAYSAANALRPGRRPVSSMAPTIVMRDGRPVGCAGASGGGRIPTATTQVLANMMLFGMDPEAAVASPRVHHQGSPNELLVDPEVPADVRAALRARGYVVRERDGVLAAVQALWLRNVGGVREILAASDPRKGGAPAGD